MGISAVAGIAMASLIQKLAISAATAATCRLCSGMSAGRGNESRIKKKAGPSSRPTFWRVLKTSAAAGNAWYPVYM